MDSSRKQGPILIIQSAISIGESVKRLLVPHNIITFFSDGGIDKFMARQSTFFHRSPPVPEFNAFNWVKLLCHTFRYLERPGIMDSSSNKLFVNYLF